MHQSSMSSSTIRESNLSFLKSYYQEKKKFEEGQASRFSNEIYKLGSIFQKLTNQIQSKIQNLEALTQDIRNISHDGSKRASQFEQGEARFNEVNFNIPDIREKNRAERMEVTKVFCSDLCRKIITKGFKWFQEGKLTDTKLRQFFCNNFLSNTIKFASHNKLDEKQLKQMDQHLKKKVFSFLKQRYPQSESEPNRKFQNIITPVDNFDSNDNDQVFQSGVTFQFKKNGDYSAEIMKFINYLLRTTREQQLNKGNLFNMFYKQMQQIFQKVQNQEWMILAKKGKFSEEDKIKRISSTTVQNKNSEEKKRDLEEQAKRQQYKKSVKSYTKYLIGQKISDNVPLFSDKQIKQQNLNINNAGIMRIIAKWCQQLEKCFEEVNINSRDERFRMADGSERYIKKAHRKELYMQLCQQQKGLQEFLSQVKNNIYQNQSKILQTGQCFTAFRDFTSESEGIAGYFATAMKKSYENYLISYLNKLIHCILSAQQTLKARYTRRQHYKMDANLISFKVGDLLRCKCASKQTQIIALYNYLKHYCANNKDKLQLVRVKNRLNEGTKDILINFRFHQKLLVEMQLSIDQETSNFIKCSDKANHFIYELERATFGPISQICSIYGNIDPRAEFFRKKFEEHNSSKIERHHPQNQCHHEFSGTSLPVWCSQCGKYYSTLNLITKHKKCNICKFNRCSVCVVKKGQIQGISIKPAHLNFKDLIHQSGSLIKKKLTVVDLQKKDLKQSLVFVVYFNFKIMIFEPLGEKGLSLLGQAKNDNQLKKILANKQIVSEQNIAREQQQQYVPQIYNAIAKTMIKNVNKMMRKYFVYEEVKTDQETFNNQRMQTVEQINMNNASLTSIDGLVNAFPNARVILVHKNKIKSLNGVSKWKEVQQLNLQGNQLTQIPGEVKTLENLDFLILSNNKFTKFPQELCQIPNLRVLNFKVNKVPVISKNIKKMKKLQVLRLTNNKITEIPEQIVGASQLKEIDVSGNDLRNIPISLKRLVKLQEVLFENNKIASIPDDLFENMSQISKVYFAGNQITSIPSSLRNKQKLSIIDLSINKIRIVPEFIFDLPALTELILSQNQIEQIIIRPGSNNTKLKSIQLINNRLRRLPEELYNITTLQKVKIGGPMIQVPSDKILQLHRLKQLSMESMNLREIPRIVLDISHLETLSLDNNQISSIPPEISKMQRSLHELYLSNNKFRRFPTEVYSLNVLQNLGLNKNQLTEIPSDIKAMYSLEKLKIEENNIKDLPEQLIRLPRLKQLSLTKSIVGEQTIKKIKSINRRVKIVDLSIPPNDKKQKK